MIRPTSAVLACTASVRLRASGPPSADRVLVLAPPPPDATAGSVT